MVSIATTSVDKRLQLPSSFKFSKWKKDQWINLANIRSLVSLTFFKT